MHIWYITTGTHYAASPTYCYCCIATQHTTRRSLLGDGAFAVAGLRTWNSLPQFVTLCSSPLTSKKYLKTYCDLDYLFRSRIRLLTMQSALVVAMGEEAAYDAIILSNYIV